MKPILVFIVIHLQWIDLVIRPMKNFENKWMDTEFLQKMKSMHRIIKYFPHQKILCYQMTLVNQWFSIFVLTFLWIRKIRLAYKRLCYICKRSRSMRFVLGFFNYGCTWRTTFCKNITTYSTFRTESSRLFITQLRM